MSFPPGTEMFQFPGFASLSLFYSACHVLHRLCMPRHPPIALTSRLRIHTTIDNPACMTGADIRWVVFFIYDRRRAIAMLS